MVAPATWAATVMEVESMVRVKVPLNPAAVVDLGRFVDCVRDAFDELIAQADEEH